jgi:eukaryotic-like serine/threonine-protein kinase
LVCPKCGAETPADRDRCGACGQPLATAGGSSPVGIGPPIELSEAETGAPSPQDAPAGFASGQPGAAAVLLPGQTFGGRYRIIRELGRGGMGVVYQAWDDDLGMAVALKIVRTDAAAGPVGAELLDRRFKRELVLARKVTHKHVIRIHDLGQVDGTKYLTMPFVQGRTLADVIRAEGRLPVPRAIALAKQIVSGLVAAHEAGIVHRDLKPANIMIDADECALILDFGIARSVSQTTVLSTLGGGLVGTLGYMAPEQVSGEEVDQRADVYAMGLILYDMLLGGRPTGDSPLSDLMARAKQAPPPVRSLDQSVPAALDAVVTRCLQTDPGMRFQTSSALAEALGELDANGHRVVARERRSWPRSLTAAVAVIGVSLAGVAAWQFLVREQPGTTTATTRPPVRVLVADFDNRTGDADFDDALPQTLALAIENASFVTPYPRQDARKALAAISSTAKLDEAGSRLVARREGIEVVLAGSIARNGGGYTIDVKVINPATDTPTAEIQERAARKADSVSAVVSLAGRARTALGDTATAAELNAAAETFTAASLDAVRDYARGQDLLLSRKDAEAIVFFRQAIEHDPKFGRAYAGWAVAAQTLGRDDEAREQWKMAVSLIDRMTEREKYRTFGSYHLQVTRDYRQAIEALEKLVTLYPSDSAGHNNLAMAYFYTLNFKKAAEEGARALAIWPRSARFLSNSSLYAMYAGDFAAATRQSTALIAQAPGSYIAYLPLAVAQSVGGDLAAARETYGRMAATDAAGRSLAAIGLADLALYEGRAADARAILSKGLTEDERAQNTAGIISKKAALADAALLEGDLPPALAGADALVALGKRENTLVPAAAIYLAAGRTAAARQLAAELLKRVPPEPRAYAKIIEGRAALQEHRVVEAIDALRTAEGLADVWLARFWLGIAYVESGDYVGAMSEFDSAFARRGEATALFLDDLPTVRYLAPLHYWMGRAKEGMGAPAAAEHYKQFLALRPVDSKDPLAIDARKRLAPK